jgi:hypothetical protein
MALYQVLFPSQNLWVRRIGITDYRMLQKESLGFFHWQNDHTKCHKNPCSESRGITYGQSHRQI